MIGTAHDTMSCKVCGSRRTVRVGRINGVQRWECRDCGRRFMQSDTRFGMKTPAFQVDMAIKMYYQGMSLNAIRKHLHQKYNNLPSDSTVYHWVEKYTDIAISKSRDYQPNVGNKWLMYNTTLNYYSEPLWILDVIDKDTLFLLATRVLLNNNADAVKVLVSQAVQKAGKIPEMVIINDMAALLGDIGLDSVVKIEYGNFDALLANDKHAAEFKHFCSALEKRKNHMVNLKSIGKIIKFNDGWLVYYNYFRPLKSMGGKTPAEVAKTRYPPWGLS